MHKKKHPSDSNDYTQRRHRRAKRLWQQNKDLIRQSMRNESKTFSHLYREINEAANVKSYPSQALGRKRNMFLKALALDEDKFREWVQNRLYRIAYDNKRSITDFTPRDISMGLQKWEGILRNSDPGFGKYDEQFKAYTDRFLSVATSLLGNPATAQGTKGVEPHEAPSLQSKNEPVSPTMLDYAVDKKTQAPTQSPQSQQGGDTEEQPQILPEEEAFLQGIQEIQTALSMKDKQFMNYVENKLMEDGVDLSSANVAEIDQALDEEFQRMLDSVPEGSQFNQDEQMLEELYGQYKERFLTLFQKMQGKFDQKLEKADQVASIRKQKLQKDPSLFEVGFVLSLASSVGVPLEETGISELELAKIQKDQITYASSRRLVSNLIASYPHLSKTIPYWMGRETSPSELSQEWSGSDGTSTTDIVLSFGDKKKKFKNNKFSGCSPESKENNCISDVKILFKINEMSLTPKNPKESNMFLERTIEFLRTRDYDFSSQSALYQRLLADGMDSSTAREISQVVYQDIQQLKAEFTQLAQSPDFKNEMKNYLKNLSVKVQDIIHYLPSVGKEFVYRSLSGAGKFDEGSRREANFILSSDENGDKMVFVKLDRDLAGQIASQSQVLISVTAPKLSKKDLLVQRYVDMGMTEEEATNHISLDHPYRLSDYTKAVEQYSQTNMLLTSPGTILPESSELYSFIRNMKALFEQEQPIAPQMDPELEEYINAAVDYAFDTFTNMIRFFGFEFKDVVATELNLYNMFYAQQPQNMAADLNNRVDMNNQLGDEMEQNRMENGVQNKWFEYKQKGRPSV